jgi:hypothetical protein
MKTFSTEKMPKPPEFIVEENIGLKRTHQAITIGVPFSKGYGFPNDLWLAKSLSNKVYAISLKALSFHEDESIQWALITFVLDQEANCVERFTIEKRLESSFAIDSTSLKKRARSALKIADVVLIEQRKEEVSSSFKAMPPDIIEIDLEFALADGTKVKISNWVCDYQCSDDVVIRRRLIGRSERLKKTHVIMSVNEIIETSLVDIEIAIRNENSALHPDGYWDLGDPNSINLESVSLCFKNSALSGCNYLLNPNLREGSKTLEVDTMFSISQTGSGMQNWQHQVHVNSEGIVPITQNGYSVLSAGNLITRGLCADPAVQAISDTINLVIYNKDFWERFPSEISSSHGGIYLWLLPKGNSNHEIQPGETLCKRFSISTEQMFTLELFQNVSRPLIARPTIESCVNAEALEWLDESERPYFTNHEVMSNYCENALSGETGLFSKRIAIDEFGWRNFGEVWADHEQAFAAVTTSTLVSHYNNQYDQIQGFLRRFLDTGDDRWLSLGQDLARHVVHIDVYNTDDDRPAYNRGLFWHTAHYSDAATATHRSHSRHMAKGENPTEGGGPGSSEQNYTTGLLLYYFLTGDEFAKETIINFANWVIAMDDGNRNWLSVLSSANTGSASCTASRSYHGPGRGVGNSVNCLIDAWKLTKNELYLTKAEELIKRVAHPSERISDLDLLNAEARWSYTVFIQSLLKYLSLEQLRNRHFASYIKACLIHYGQWMADNEQTYFSSVEELEYPTETWHAQDLRKANIMHLIASFCPDEKIAQKLISKSTNIRKEAWQCLEASPTRYYARPIALVLQQWPLETFSMGPSATKYGTSIRSIPALVTIDAKVEFIYQRLAISKSVKSPSWWAGVLLRCCSYKYWKLPFFELRRGILGELYKRRIHKQRI